MFPLIGGIMFKKLREELKDWDYYFVRRGSFLLFRGWLGLSVLVSSCVHINPVSDVLAESHLITNNQPFPPGKNYVVSFSSQGGSSGGEAKYFGGFEISAIEKNGKFTQIYGEKPWFAYSIEDYREDFRLINSQNKNLVVVMEQYSGCTSLVYHRPWELMNSCSFSEPLLEEELVFEGYCRSPIGYLTNKKVKIEKIRGDWTIKPLSSRRRHHHKSTKKISSLAIDPLIQEIKKTYSSQLDKFGDLNNDGRISFIEQKKFQKDMIAYGQSKAKSFADWHFFPNSGTKKYFALAHKWIQEYSPNWRDKK